MKNLITLNDTEIKLITKNGQHWITASDIAKCLGYQSAKSVTNLYTRRKDEFTDDMTVVIKLMAKGQKTDTRLFNLRGVHLITLLARTEKAKAFRKAVLDMIEDEQLRLDDKRSDELKSLKTLHKEEKEARIFLENKAKPSQKQKKPVPFARLSLPEAITPGHELATNFACIRETSSTELGVQTETAFHQTFVYVSQLIRNNKRLEQENQTLKQAFDILKA